MTFPLSPAPNRWVFPVTPVITVPDRYQTYRNEVGFGTHSPGTAVRVWPTCGVPLIVGTGLLVNVAFTTVYVYADVFDTGA
jgi:hypothetical protein